MDKIRKRKNIVHGWGINDTTYQLTLNRTTERGCKRYWICPVYQDWVSMIERVYGKRYEMSTTYFGVKIHEDWKYFSNFRNWVLNVQPNKDWENCDLDKDLLSVESNKLYSPETCVYLSRLLNSFLSSRHKEGSGKYLTGVAPAPKDYVKIAFSAKCHNPFTKKIEYLGMFDTELEAHLAWRSKKQEHALKLSELEKDPRVVAALIEYYK